METNIQYLDASPVSRVASTFARTIGGSFALSRLAALSYSGANFRQLPHLTFVTESLTAHNSSKTGHSKQLFHILKDIIHSAVHCKIRLRERFW